MKTEEIVETKQDSFFSKIKRGFSGLSLEASPESLEIYKAASSSMVVPAVEPSLENTLSPSGEVSFPPVKRRFVEELEEVVLKCEGAAGPKIRRDRGYGPTITHSTSAKSQTRWLSAEAEAVAIAEAVAETQAAAEPQAIAAPQPDPVPASATPDNSTPTGSPDEPHTIIMANNLKESLNELMQIDGAVAVALVDSSSGMAMATAGSGPLNLEVAAAGNSEVVRSKLKVMKALGLRENIEDILISLSTQYHLIRPLTKAPEVFVYLVLNRSNANLAMARFKLASIEKDLEI